MGDLIDSSTNKLLNDFQQKKEQELLDVILQDDHSITSEMVNDVEFIINFARAKEAVQRLATTDKVEYFGNLIRNGYLQGKHIDGSIFDEYIHILNTMSYREIQYLVEYKKYCEDSSKRGKSTKHINGRTYSNKYESFCNEYSKQIKVSPGEVDYVFLHIKQTGFIEEEFETESGDVDENDNTFDSLDVESIKTEFESVGYNVSSSSAYRPKTSPRPAPGKPPKYASVFSFTYAVRYVATTVPPFFTIFI